MRSSKLRFLYTVLGVLTLAIMNLAGQSHASGAPVETILWSFGNGTDAQNPLAGLIMDKGGNLYGTTQNGGIFTLNGIGFGTAFKLTPPTSATGGSWSESILWNFGNINDGIGPRGGLMMDKSDQLYGTTSTCVGLVNGEGTVFRLKPPSTSGENWSELNLWSFCLQSACADGGSPQAGLIMDKKGNLYGTTVYGGAYGGRLSGGRCSS